MTHRHYTKDEAFVLAIYEMANSTGDPENPVDRYTAGDLAHLHPKAVDAIGKLLLRSNFIKKEDERLIYLTPRGLELVERLRLE